MSSFHQRCCVVSQPRNPAKSTAGSVVNAPYSIKDGDLLAICDVALDPEGKDDWMRVEDYCVMAREQSRQEALREARAAKASYSGGGGGGGKRGVEVRRSHAPSVPIPTPPL